MDINGLVMSLHLYRNGTNVLFREEELPDYEAAFSEVYTFFYACTKREKNEKSKKEENNGEKEKRK